MSYSLPIGAAWLVSVVLVEAAVIDGKQLRVPNWLTFHLAAGGLAFWAWSAGWSALGWSFAGLVAGLLPLLLLNAIGGMGAGDVKLMAGVGAWVGPMMVLQAFLASAVVGGIIAVGMVVWSGQWWRHYAMAHQILGEIITIKNPDRLAEIAAERKPKMTLLPYAIPLAIGSIASFAYAGLLG